MTNKRLSDIKVSAIVIARSEQAGLPAAVGSLLEQTLPLAEIIVAGNGVHLPAMAERAGASSPDDQTTIVYTRFEANLGVAVGRNRAADNATGEWLLFLDDDATLAPTALERACQQIQAEPAIGAIAFQVLDPTTRRPALWYHGVQPDLASWRVPAVVGCAQMVERRLFKQIGGFWPGYFREMEEIDLSWRCHGAGRPVLFVRDAIATHSERTLLHSGNAIFGQLALVWRLLPAQLAARQTAFLFLLLGARSVRGRETISFLVGVRRFLGSLGEIKASRQPLDDDTIDYLVSAHTRLTLGKRLQWGRPSGG